MIDYGFVREVVMLNSGIVLEPTKDYLIESRLAGLARAEGLPSIEAVVARMKACCVAPTAPHPLGERCWKTRTVEALTTNETTFFRDARPFDLLRDDVLPGLIERRKQQRELRIWYAASSTGQEPYSVAMLLEEHFPQLAGWNIEQIGTDLSEPVLSRARDARYSQLEVNRGLPPHLLAKYFVKEDQGWRLREAIRRKVTFQQLNLNGAWPPLPSFDIVFLRNVMIYFSDAAKKRLLARVFDRLRSDGFLFLGAAETTLNLDPRFERVAPGAAGCYRIARPS